MNSISFRVYSMDGRACDVCEVAPDATLQEIQTLVADSLGFSVLQMELVYGERVLPAKQSCTLEELGIADGIDLLCVARYQCGPCGGQGCIFCDWGGKLSEDRVRARKLRSSDALFWKHCCSMKKNAEHRTEEGREGPGSGLEEALTSPGTSFESSSDSLDLDGEVELGEGHATTVVHCEQHTDT
eukprot:TRINITY_DN26491_c0_g1_i1.p2 TRINITY_DN26491_c0_g1~~TRINITY_DN26491_c0_g1_i1.p2  ORF type:complete len:185 (+),score=35.69 TRINITY_DN26491_c0_g1_i1:119-673(+)